MRSSFWSALLLLAAPAFLVGCGDDDDHHGDGICQDLATTCHTVGEMGGRLAECHELGHAGDEAACEAEHDECIALCQAAVGDGGGHGHDDDAGEHHEDGGVEDGDSGHGGPGEFCGPLGSLCHDVPGGEACHELGHDGDEGACEAMYDACLAICAPDGGA